MIKLETRAWFDPGASRLAERICDRARVGPESCRVRHTAPDRCGTPKQQQVKPKNEVVPSSYTCGAVSTTTYDPFYVNHKFHVLLVCIYLVSCSHETHWQKAAPGTTSRRRVYESLRVRVCPIRLIDLLPAA